MHTGDGLRGYFYDYVFYRAIDEARDQTGQVVAISEARAARDRAEAILNDRATSFDDPRLNVVGCLTAIDQALIEQVPGYEPQFGDHTSADPRYAELQQEFSAITGVGSPQPVRDAALPISPYDPRWAGRATLQRAGSDLRYLPDSAIVKATGGPVGALAEPHHGGMTLYRRTDRGRFEEAGKARTLDDATGLTALRSHLTDAEYREVREWAIDGAKDATGAIRYDRFTPPRAVARSVAVLRELEARGRSFTVSRDRRPGQLKATLDGGLEVRLLDTEPNGAKYAGARIYDRDGITTRYSTNLRGPGGGETHDPSPDEAVQLLRYALGQPIDRTDRPRHPVGVVGSTHTERGRWRGSAPVEIQDAYHVDREAMAVVGDYVVPGEPGPRPGAKLLIRRDATNRTLPMWFVDADAATRYGQAAVTSARDNLVAGLDVDTLVAHAESEQRRTSGDRDAMQPPDYSPTTEVAAIQRSYWDVLTGARADLLRPGATTDLYEERLDALGAVPPEDATADLGNLVYTGTAEEKVRAHAADVPFEMIGTWEAKPHLVVGEQGSEWVDRRFDPVRVAAYMESSTGRWSNLDNLAAALRRCEADPAEMLGQGFQTARFRDRLVRFDPATAQPMSQHPSAFLRQMGEVVRDSLARNAAVPGEILIDETGVVQWTAERVRRDGQRMPIIGAIGQIFAPGEHGEIVTQFASGENALVVPGYEARVVAPVPGAPASLEERTRLRGYTHLMTEQIQRQVAGDLVSGRSQTDNPAVLNGAYSALVGINHPVDYLERATQYARGTDGTITRQVDPMIAAILDTEARRIRYDNTLKEGSTTHAWAARTQGTQRTDPADDTRRDPWRLTGGRNLRVLTAPGQDGLPVPGGYLDPVLTANAGNQGIVRYLVAGASVNADGSITPGDPSTPEGSAAPLRLRTELVTMGHDAWDRQQMSLSTIMQSATVTPSTGAALMTLGGWTADDGIVVSQEFAEQHAIHGIGGRLRSLGIGDKLSDTHGNKGVIAAVIDRGMSPSEAAAHGLDQEVVWFRDNPDLHVVMSPFSLISRRNAGAGRELMTGGAEGAEAVSDLRAPDGTVRPGSLGQLQLVVTHMAVDAKTQIYDDEAVLAGRGRKASGQLAWALGAADCPGVLREFYGHNSGVEAGLREHLQVTGLDLDADGTLRVIGRHDSLDDQPERRRIEMPELIRTQPRRAGRPPWLNTPAMRKSFAALIRDRGGELALPFPLTFPTGEQTPRLSDTPPRWGLPLLSSHLRSGQDLGDGFSTTHDYTGRYTDIMMAACRHQHLTEQLASGIIPGSQRETAQRDVADAQRQAQRAYDSIAHSVQDRVFQGKHNHVKTGVMASRLADSASMVWSADPRLDIDQVAMNAATARQLGLNTDDHVLVWRDPILRDNSVKYLRVAINDDLTGVAVNPVIAPDFDGDFDGDAIGLARLNTPTARAEALDKLTVAANLVDTGVSRADGSHPLVTAIALDTQVACARNPELAEEFDSAIREANRLHRLAADERAQTGAVSEDTRLGQQTMVEELSDLYRQAHTSEYGSALSFATPEAHLESIRAVCVTTGAKGSESKLADYARYFIDGPNQDDQHDSMGATGIKTDVTGVAGVFSQRAVAALRNAGVLQEALELTYPVTQSVLQAKHDAAEAAHKQRMLAGPGRDLWRGYQLEHTGGGKWTTVRDDQGTPVPATGEEWTTQFVEFYQAKDGFNVAINPDFVTKVAGALTDPATGLMRNLEDDPALTPTTMDTLAYGGTFDDWVRAADQRANLYDGRWNECFAPAGTRAARAETARQLEALGVSQAGPRAVDAPGVEAPVVITPSVRGAAQVKSDVIAGGSTRGGSRRSRYAVGVGAGVKGEASTRPSYTPSSYQDLSVQDHAADQEMGY